MAQDSKNGSPGVKRWLLVGDGGDEHIIEYSDTYKAEDIKTKLPGPPDLYGLRGHDNIPWKVSLVMLMNKDVLDKPYRTGGYKITPLH